MALKSRTKSIILGIIVILANFLGYFTYRLIFFKEISFFESFGFAIYISILDFLVVFFGSSLLKLFK